MPLTLGIIGCGSLGTAILNVLLASAKKPGNEDLPQQFIVSVTSRKSSARVRSAVADLGDIDIRVGDNVKLADEAGIIILSCPPDAVSTLLGESGMRRALSGKLVISVAAGVTGSRIEKAIYGDSPPPEVITERCWVVRAMPNVAASIGQSMTGVEVPEPLPPKRMLKQVDRIFKEVGSIIHLLSSQMDACSALCGSSPAFIALFCDALIDGAIAAGLPRDKAQVMATETLVGTAALLRAGQSPSTLRENVCANPGCTITGIMTLEEGGVRGVIAKAMKQSIIAASQLG